MLPSSSLDSTYIYSVTHCTISLLQIIFIIALFLWEGRRRQYIPTILHFASQNEPSRLNISGNYSSFLKLFKGLLFHSEDSPNWPTCLRRSSKVRLWPQPHFLTFILTLNFRPQKAFGGLLTSHWPSLSLDPLIEKPPMVNIPTHPPSGPNLLPSDCSWSPKLLAPWYEDLKHLFQNTHHNSWLCLTCPLLLSLFLAPSL